MKAKFAVLALAAVSLFVPACEQHKWSETKKLFEEKGEEAGKKEATPAKEGKEGSKEEAKQ